MKKFFIFFCCLFFSLSQGQTVYKYYVYLYNSSSKPDFIKQGNYSVYAGNNVGLTNFFKNYKIINFDKAFPSTNWESFSRILILETESSTLANDLLVAYPSVYRKMGDITNDVAELQYYPDDYGSTNPSTPGNAIKRDDLDYSNTAKAWDITTGINAASVRSKVGLSDAKINTTDTDFLNKVSFVGVGSWQNVPYSTANTQAGLLSKHGTGVGGIMAAAGDNGYGSTGVCYNCDIVHTAFNQGPYTYSNLLSLAQSGVKAINISWVDRAAQAPYDRSDPNNPYEAQQLAIDSIIKHYKVVVVAAAGNWSSYQDSSDHECSSIFGTNWGINYCFPASYDGVISVSTVSHRFPYILPLIPDENISPSYSTLGSTNNPYGIKIFYSIQGSITSVNGNDPYNPVGMIYNGWPQTTPCSSPSQPLIIGPRGLTKTATTNPEVDILAPTINTFNFATYAEENQLVAYTSGGTSGAAPRVTGTAALMKTVNDCLTPDEVDDILKLTSKDVEQYSFNLIYHGQIGAGALDTGNAVEFVNEMKKINGNAVIQNHVFDRFDFKLFKINNNLKIENVTFKDNCKVDFKARTQINLKPGTNLKPNASGNVYLSINPAIDISCAPVVFPRHSESGMMGSSESKILLYPNPNKGTFEIVLNNVAEFRNTNVTVDVIDINGRVIHNQNVQTDSNDDFNISLIINNVTDGLYFVKLSSGNRVETLKFVKR